MKKLLAILALSFAVTSVAANNSTVDVSKLTPEQVAQINQQVSAMTKEPVNVSATVRKEAEAWGELGANMGKAMVGAAREVGVASNEFAKTDLGKIIVFIVAYKVIGQDILSIAFGSLVLFFGWGIAIWALKTKAFADIKYEYVPVFKGMFNRKRITSIVHDENSKVLRILLGGASLFLSSVVGLNLIF